MNTMSIRTLSALARVTASRTMTRADRVAPTSSSPCWSWSGRGRSSASTARMTARRRQCERRQLAAIPEWFSAEDVIAAPRDAMRAHLA
jgi:hypothetical protein